MAKFRIVIHTSNKRKDGSYPVCLRITKNGKLKYIYLNLSAFENEWDKNADRFKRDKRMNPNYESYNNWLISCEERKNEVVNKFMKAQVDWTLNQFEEEFLGISRQGKIYDYWMRQVEDLKATGHIGNGKVYERDLYLTGEIYHKGLYGEDIDLEVAYSFYQEAADLGCEEAEEVLNLKPSDSIRHCK